MLRWNSTERVPGWLNASIYRSREVGRRFFTATGTVKWFNDSKGYGFISPDDGEKDLFVHHTSISGGGYESLAEGANVEYEAAEGAGGPEAKNLTLAG
jgi:cold shock protein